LQFFLSWPKSPFENKIKLLVCFSKTKTNVLYQINDQNQRSKIKGTTRNRTTKKKTPTMLSTLMLLVAAQYAQYAHADCTIPANAIGPVNGQLGDCIRGSTLTAGSSCAYCKFYAHLFPSKYVTRTKRCALFLYLV